MSNIIAEVEAQFKKPKVVSVRSGDTVRVHQRIKEGNKERIQVFEGLVIKTARMNSHTATITVRRIASGVGVEKTYQIHSPLIEKIEVTKRAKVRRNYLSYMRQRGGKSARLGRVDFDQDAVNDVAVPVDESKAAKEAEEALKEVPKEDPQAKEADGAEDKAEEDQEAVETEEKTAAEAKEGKVEAKEEKSTDDKKTEAKAEEPTKPETKEDKAAAKKAKAEEFRKQQEAKN